ncbi:hypothetical protein E4U14_006945 [Claviceps sp. LM454 group G7]|nr:hypothetical protein E4U14_006945 [Claviceps sp. LM454 group G7]
MLEASGTEWNDETRSFELSGAQGDGLIHKFGTRASRIIDHGYFLTNLTPAETSSTLFDADEARSS